MDRLLSWIVTQWISSFQRMHYRKSPMQKSPRCIFHGKRSQRNPIQIVSEKVEKAQRSKEKSILGEDAF
jgi:hypothetical protein